MIERAGFRSISFLLNLHRSSIYVQVEGPFYVTWSVSVFQVQTMKFYGFCIYTFASTYLDTFSNRPSLVVDDMQVFLLLFLLEFGRRREVVVRGTSISLLGEH
jgi:hypothetical protein